MGSGTHRTRASRLGLQVLASRAVRLNYPGPTMLDDKTEGGGQHRGRINLGEDCEVRRQAKRFGLQPELRAAVKGIGNGAAAIAAHSKDIKQ